MCRRSPSACRAAVDLLAATPVTEGLTGHPSADNRGELLLLADQNEARQARILDLMLGDGERAATVAEAIAKLDGTHGGPSLSPPERFHQSFSRLSWAQQETFFDLNAEAIERWSAARAGKRRRALGRAA